MKLNESNALRFVKSGRKFETRRLSSFLRNDCRPTASDGYSPHFALRKVFGGERGIRTLDTRLTYTPLAGERLQPLGHLSVRAKRLNIYGFSRGRSTPNTHEKAEHHKNRRIFWHKADTQIPATFSYSTRVR